MIEKAMLARLRALEKQRGPIWPGLRYLQILVEVEERADAEVVAVDVGGFDGNATRVQRLPGETLTELEARANPLRTLDAAPRPVFADGASRYDKDLSEVIWWTLKHGGVLA